MRPTKAKHRRNGTRRGIASALLSVVALLLFLPTGASAMTASYGGECCGFDTLFSGSIPACCPSEEGVTATDCVSSTCGPSDEDQNGTCQLVCLSGGQEVGCSSSSDPGATVKCVENPRQEEQPEQTEQAATTASGDALERVDVPFTELKPTLEIDIPTVSLSSATSYSEGDDRFITLPWIADYLLGAYRYGVFAASVIGTVMLMVGGFQWLTAAGSPERVNKAKERITNALVGLALTFGSYLILVTVNPDLVLFNSLRIRSASRIEFMPPLASVESEDVSPPGGSSGGSSSGGGSGGGTMASGGGVDTSTLVQVSEDCIRIAWPGVHPDIADAVRRAGEIFCQLRGSNTSWKIRGGAYRGPDTGVQMFVRRCLYRSSCTVATGSNGLRQNGATSMVGGRLLPNNPAFQGSSYTHEAMMRGGREFQAVYNWLLPQASTRASAHGNALALDITCDVPGKNTGAFHPYVPCHVVLEQAMKQAGFCRLNHEFWHFEYNDNKMSRSCNGGFTPGQYQPQAHRGDNTVSNYSSCPEYWAHDRTRCVDR